MEMENGGGDEKVFRVIFWWFSLWFSWDDWVRVQNPDIGENGTNSWSREALRVGFLRVGFFRNGRSGVFWALECSWSRCVTATLTRGRGARGFVWPLGPGGHVEGSKGQRAKRPKVFGAVCGWPTGSARCTGLKHRFFQRQSLWHVMLENAKRRFNWMESSIHWWCW